MLNESMIYVCMYLCKSFSWALSLLVVDDFAWHPTSLARDNIIIHTTPDLILESGKHSPSGAKWYIFLLEESQMMWRYVTKLMFSYHHWYVGTSRNISCPLANAMLSIKYRITCTYEMYLCRKYLWIFAMDLGSFPEINSFIPQAYINKGRTPIQIFPVPNAYTNSFVVCILCMSKQQKNWCTH